MLQQRKKDYLQRIIEELFAKIFQLVHSESSRDSKSEKMLLNDCYVFFFDNFGIENNDTALQIVEKCGSYELSTQYAELLKIDFELNNTKDKTKLERALFIVQLLNKTDTTFSWERQILQEDILRMLDESE